MARTTIYWAKPWLGDAAQKMADDDLDNLSRFISKLVAKEFERRRQARQLVDSRVKDTTEEVQ
jgi:hypothetical protein